MKKRFLSLAISTFLTLALLPQAALAADYIEVAPPKYAWIGDYHEGMAFFRVEDENGDDKYGYIDNTGTEVVPAQYTRARDFSEGLAAVMVGEGISGEKYGYIDKTGKVVIPPQYDRAEPFSEGLARVHLRNDGVSDGGSDGFIDKTGKVVVPFGKYISQESFSEGLASVIDFTTSNWRALYVNKNGEEIIFPGKDYNSLSSFSEGMASATKRDDPGGGFGFIDQTGREITPFKYTRVSPFSDGMAAVSTDGYNNWGFIDKTGKEVVPPKYTSVHDFSDGLAVVNIGGRTSGSQWGVIDKSGREVIPFGKYEYIASFSEGLVAVAVGGHFYTNGQLSGYAGGTWSCIDSTGREVISLQDRYQEVSFFSEGIMRVEVISRYDNHGWPSHRFYGYIDKAGKEIVPPTYRMLGFVRDGVGVFEDTRWQFSDDGMSAQVTGEGVLSLPGAAPYVPGTSAAPLAPIVPTVAPSPCVATLDDLAYALNGYLFTEGGGGTNYVMLRDVATLLNGSQAQFEVTWDKDRGIVLATGQAYTPVGGEMRGKDDDEKPYTANTSAITVDGKSVTLDAYTIEGNNYFKLRDLSAVLGFNVDWDSTTNTVIIDIPAD